MFTWGQRTIEENTIDQTSIQPAKVTIFENQDVQQASLNQSTSVVLLKDGSVYAFLGHCHPNSIISNKVTALETIVVKHVFAGHCFVLVIDDRFRVYGWGRNQHGQIGLPESDFYPSPKPVKALQYYQIISVACGEAHSLFLTSSGVILACGSNEYGQLGTGDAPHSSNEMKIIQSLGGIPFAQIAAGSWHSLAVTVSGAVFGWGRNDNGQLGVGDCENRSAPVLLKSLRSQVIKHVASGSYHTAALTMDGGLFTFGSNKQGQLGHGKSSESSLNPRKVFEHMGDTVTQTACGSCHTLTFVSSSNQIYAFGDNSSGQLGYGVEKVGGNFLPHAVTLPGNNSKQSVPTTSAETTGEHAFIKEISAGGDESAVTYTKTSTPSADFRKVPPEKKIFTLSDELIAKLQSLSNETRIMPDVERYLQTVMSSASCLNASFLTSDHYKTTTSNHGVSLMAARLGFNKLCSCSCSRVQEVMMQSLQHRLIPCLVASPPDMEALRVYLILPECQLFEERDNYLTLLIPFAKKCSMLVSAASKVLDKWYRSMEPLYFTKPVNICKDCVMQILRRPVVNGVNMFGEMKFVLDYLGKLNHANDSGEKSIIPYQHFYLPAITDLINLEEDYIKWVQGRPGCICQYPFVLNSQAKTSLLQIDAVWQMRSAYSEAHDRNMSSLFGYGQNQYLETLVLELEVRRGELVHDALTSLANVDMRSLKKPLVVKFAGEEGQDAGGVRKEFFMLILKEVIDPKYGMFQYFEESRLIWFSDFELETEMMYFLVGLLCGLAIYNNTIIDICFPLALYKKLLGATPTLIDLQELDPTMARSLKQLLEFDGGNIEDIFCLDFTVNRENFGESRVVELIPNGSNVPVTEQNRQEYVDTYVDFVFNKSVLHQYEAFNKGFHKVCGGKIMNLFRPMELMEMVVGNQNYNWEEFEKTADYKGEYYRQHPVMKMFWSVFHAFSLEEKKEFLLFLTGCNKVPINGVKITIQPVRTGDSHLPVAHTCFNLLDLPMYSSQSILEQKLKMAMLNNQGFHLA
uniref:Probable E3 ubiquitin-protein ligase HERC4 n=1 Tax=Phallusia mammillata TaxID=59560 RepID=A0A6F9DDR9_9ASCI|nr:probable E3 ubiquitin-protein ligase HERC4 [Phallusia mammillata]